VASVAKCWRQKPPNFVFELCDCLTMSSMHWYPHNPQHRRYTTLDIADTHYNCHHTPHACQTLTSLYECSIKTNIRHVTFELLLCILCLLCILGLRSVMPLINEDWLIDWLIDWALLEPANPCSVHCPYTAANEIGSSELWESSAIGARSDRVL